VSTSSVCLRIYWLCGQSVSRYVVSIYCVHIVRLSQNILAVWSVWLTIRCINLCCPRVRVSRHILPMWSKYLGITVRVVRVYRHNCPCGQSISGIIVRVVRVSRHNCPCARWTKRDSQADMIRLMVMISMAFSRDCSGQGDIDGCDLWLSRSHISPRWSEWLAIYCVNRCCLHARVSPTWSEYNTIYWLCGQSGSRYVVSIYCVHIVGMCHHILPVWSEYHTIYCPCGQSRSAYIACVVNMAHDMLYQSTVFTSSACLNIWFTSSACLNIWFHVVRVAHDMLYQPVLSTRQSVSTYGSMWSEWLTICCINPLCPHRRYVSAYIARMVSMAHVMLCQSIVSMWSKCLGA